MTIKKTLQEFKRTHQDNWQVSFEYLFSILLIYVLNYCTATQSQCVLLDWLSILHLYSPFAGTQNKVY